MARRNSKKSASTRVENGAFELVELRLLADPEYAKRHHAQHPGQEARRERHERVRQIRFGMNVADLGRVNVEHDQGHRDGEHAVAKRRYTPDVPRGDAIVSVPHCQCPRESR
jgi:hypothetical protein